MNACCADGCVAHVGIASVDELVLVIEAHAELELLPDEGEAPLVPETC